eukprot:jgi/Botrbrau1/17576/Bobra.0166s0020.3
MVKEVEMKDAEEGDKPVANGTIDTKDDGHELDEGPTLHEQLKANVALLEKAVRSKDLRVIQGKLQRQTAVARKQLTPEALAAFVPEVLPPGQPARTAVLSILNKVADKMDVSSEDDPMELSESGVLPETEAYIYLLTVILLIDKKLYPEAKSLTGEAIQRLRAFNRRTLDSIAARIYFYYSWANENCGDLAAIRSELLGLYQTAVLHHDEPGQETLLNLLLRNYLHYNLYDQAEKFRSKAQRPETYRSNTQLCRYLYYLGRIRAIMLDYTDAKDCLQQASRKAPTLSHAFRITVAKWLALVRLLLGEIPEHSELTAIGLRDALRPYFELTQAVRSGDLTAFRAVAEKYQAVYRADKTHNLVVRLRHNVIRAGLRRINLAYSRISLKDVAAKLGLPSVEDTECIVAKAIRDGGIDATISHEGGYMSSKEVADIYSTNEPQQAFHMRISFCLDIHNEDEHGSQEGNQEGLEAMFKQAARSRGLRRQTQTPSIYEVPIAKEAGRFALHERQ